MSFFHFAFHFPFLLIVAAYFIAFIIRKAQISTLAFPPLPSALFKREGFPKKPLSLCFREISPT
jgi:hypothetical protein